jgi:hypothetical protein
MFEIGEAVQAGRGLQKIAPISGNERRHAPFAGIEPVATSVRQGARMNIHEYQAKAVLRDFGVPVPRGHAAFSVEEAAKAANDLGRSSWSRRKSMLGGAARPAASRW